MVLMTQVYAGFSSSGFPWAKCLLRCTLFVHCAVTKGKHSFLSQSIESLTAALVSRLLRDVFNWEQPLSGDRRPVNSALTLGFSMAVGMGMFAGLGWWLDHRRGGGVLWTTVGAGLGLLYIAYETWKVVREVNAEDARKPPRVSNARRKHGAP